MNRIRRVLCDSLPGGGWTELSEDEAHHVGKVLRLADGEELEVLDGRGRSVFATLRRRGKAIGVEDAREGREEAPPRKCVTAEIAVLKSEAMEWLIEKLTELGVHRVVPLWTDYGVIKAKAKPEEVWVSRWQNIADQALKQSGRLHRLWIDPPKPVLQLEVKAERLVLDPRGKSALREVATGDEPRYCIGPEGGFTQTELSYLLGGRDQGAAVSLGSHVLRAETAGICAASYLILA